MIKNKTVLETKVNERAYRLECSPDSPLGELHDAICEMKSYVVQMIHEANAKEHASKEDQE